MDPKHKALQQRVSITFAADRVVKAVARPASIPGTPSLIFGLDTYADVNTCKRESLYDVHKITPVEVEGTNGFITHTEIGYMRIPVDKSITRVPFLVTEELPPGVDVMLGVPAIQDLGISVDHHLRFPLSNLQPLQPLSGQNLDKESRVGLQR